MNITIGIDPGQTGAIAILREDSKIDFIDWHENIINDIIFLKASYEITICGIEKQIVMPKQGSVSTASTHREYGRYIGALEALSIPFKIIRSQEWQRHLNLTTKSKGKSKSKHKRELVQVAQRMYPQAELTGPRGGLLSGRGDALLIASYIRKTFWN